MNPVERPPERDILIPSRGYVDGRPTAHSFVRREIVPPEKLVGHWLGRPAQALIYRCVQTGAERRYGIE